MEGVAQLEKLALKEQSCKKFGETVESSVLGGDFGGKRFGVFPSTISKSMGMGVVEDDETIGIAVGSAPIIQPTPFPQESATLQCPIQWTGPTLIVTQEIPTLMQPKMPPSTPPTVQYGDGNTSLQEYVE